MRIGGIAGSEIGDASVANRSRKARTNRICTTLEIGLTTPERIFVAVRAIKPVAGIPPNSGGMILAIPWLKNSRFESCFLPSFIPSATTADNRYSIAPNAAMINAGCQSDTTFDSVICGS